MKTCVYCNRTKEDGCTCGAEAWQHAKIKRPTEKERLKIESYKYLTHSNGNRSTYDTNYTFGIDWAST